jgi:hypothetical protein
MRLEQRGFRSTVDIDGTEYAVNAGFKTVLLIRRMLGDDEVRDSDKVALLAQMFYKDAKPPMEDAVGGFEDFVAGDPKGTGIPHKGEAPRPNMDFDADADEIYSSFLHDYGIDLATEDMHWERFSVLLAGLSEESAFKRKLALREYDLTGLKGKNRTAMAKAKKAVQLPVKRTREEQAAIETFKNDWEGVGY